MWGLSTNAPRKFGELLRVCGQKLRIRISEEPLEAKPLNFEEKYAMYNLKTCSSGQHKKYHDVWVSKKAGKNLTLVSGHLRSYELLVTVTQIYSITRTAI